MLRFYDLTSCSGGWSEARRGGARHVAVWMRWIKMTAETELLSCMFALIWSFALFVSELLSIVKSFGVPNKLASLIEHIFSKVNLNSKSTQTQQDPLNIYPFGRSRVVNNHTRENIYKWNLVQKVVGDFICSLGQFCACVNELGQVHWGSSMHVQLNWDSIVHCVVLRVCRFTGAVLCMCMLTGAGLLGQF